MLNWNFKFERGEYRHTALVPMGKNVTWKFEITEYHEYNELRIVDGYGQHRPTARSKFHTMSEAKKAALDFYKEYLEPV